MSYRVVVNCLGPVQSWEFEKETPEPDDSGADGIIFRDSVGVIRDFNKRNIVAIQYFPLEKAEEKG